jgi:hypothetical protein
VKGEERMKDVANIVHIGELIAVSTVFELNTFQMVTLIENGSIEVFEHKEDFLKKYGNKESYDELDWCELNNGKIFVKPK